MYKVIIRTEASQNSPNNPLHRHITKFLPNLDHPKFCNNVKGYLHLYRNTSSQHFLMKSQVLLLLGLNLKEQQEHILSKLQSRNSEIDCIDIIIGTDHNDICAFLVVFRNLIISQEMYLYYKNNSNYLVLYLQDISIIYNNQQDNQSENNNNYSQYKDNNKFELTKNPSHQQLKTITFILDGNNNKIFSQQWVQLPTCNICLEILQSEVTGIQLTSPDQSKHNQKCQVYQNIKNKSSVICSICKDKEDNWVCLVCGFVGCGRYRNADAYKHFIASGHIVSLDIQTQRIWNYRNDCFSHRLINDQDNKNQNISQTALEGVFWDYCTLVSQQLFRQRLFYQQTKQIYQQKFKQENEELEIQIKKIQYQKQEKLENIKKQQKKYKKAQKKLIQLKQKSKEERQLNRHYQQILSQQNIQDDKQIQKKKNMIKEIDEQITKILGLLAQ